MTCHGLGHWHAGGITLYLAGEAWKIGNYAFGLINVTLFAIIFFQIQLYASLLQLFFFAANIYGWYAWSRQNSQQEAELQIRWLQFTESHRLVCRLPWSPMV